MYVELHAASAFSFLQGASLPEALVERAAALGYPAIALLDADGVYGAPRFHKAAKQAGLKAIIGAELTIDGGSTKQDPPYNCQFVLTGASVLFTLIWNCGLLTTLSTIAENRLSSFATSFAIARMVGMSVYSMPRPTA